MSSEDMLCMEDPGDQIGNRVLKGRQRQIVPQRNTISLRF